jgi:hypothetical protein
MKKGSWEVITACPNCQTPWPADANAPARNIRRIQARCAIFTFLSFVPFLGIVFGVLAVFWGYLAIKFRHVMLGITVMLVAAVVGLICQPALIWWQIGQLFDKQCIGELTTLSNSFRTYKERHHYYPESLEALRDKKEKLQVPKRCFSGGTYLYMPPWNWQITKPGSDPNEPSKVRLEVVPLQPINREPAPSEPTIPQAWASGVPMEYAPALHAASVEVTELPVPTAIAEAQNLSTLLMVVEIQPAHRYERHCIMADLSVRAMSVEEYDRLLLQPQNAVLARVLEGVRKAEADPRIVKAATKIRNEKKVEREKKAAEAKKAVASAPARGTAPASAPATAPTTAPATFPK